MIKVIHIDTNETTYLTVAQLLDWLNDDDLVSSVTEYSFTEVDD